MNEIKYHRITDWNSTIDSVIEGTEKRMTFEAAFDLIPPRSIVIRGRVVDSNGVVVLRSMDPTKSQYSPIEIYQEWNPTETLEKIIQALESDSLERPAYFDSPMCELNIEIQPTFPGQNVFGVIVTMAGKVTLLDNYSWPDSGYIGAGLLCEGGPLLAFFRGLQQDLLNLIDRAGTNND